MLVCRFQTHDQPLVLRLNLNLVAINSTASFAFPLFLLGSRVFQHHCFVAQQARRVMSSVMWNAVLQKGLGAGFSLRSALGLDIEKV